MIDVYSPTWIEIAKWAKDQIEMSQRCLEARGMTVEDTEFHRGRISAMREIVELSNPPPEIIPERVQYT